MAIELPLEIEFAPALPAVPDGANRQHDFAHPRGGPGPAGAEASFDMGANLAAEPQHEAPAADHLHVVAEVREVHRIARKGNGDRRAQANALRVFGRHRKSEKGIVSNYVATAIQRLTQRTLKFIRWLRNFAYQDVSWHRAVARLALIFQVFS